MHHDHGANFREIASFKPFDGSAGTGRHNQHDDRRTCWSAVSQPENEDASVIKYDLVRPNAQATTLQAVRVGVWSGKASQPAFLGSN